MADPQIEEQITRTQRLAGSLDINGTPAYIIGDRIIPGAIDAESLTSIVVAERQALTKAAAKVASREK
jgi:protein-disulfide isomerase